jgi:hypothetical protein
MNSSIRTFNPRYFNIAVIIFVIEVLIALYVKDKFIRPYVGDVLVVIMIYCFIRAYVDASAIKVSAFVLTFAVTLEILQYFQLIDLIGLRHNKLARIVIGTRFEWLDLVAYVVGIGIVIVVERMKDRRKRASVLGG